MATYCVVEALHTEWVVTGEIQRQECVKQGGVLQERSSPGTCGTESMAVQTFQGSSDGDIGGRSTALSLIPLRLFRAAFAKSALMAHLDEVNRLAARELGKIRAQNAELAEKVRDAFFECSLLAGAMLMNDRASLSKMRYTKAQHQRWANLARELGQATTNKEFRKALDAATEQGEAFVGKDFAEIKKELAARPAKSR